MATFKRIKVDYYLKKHKPLPEQLAIVARIVVYFKKAIIKGDEFMEISAYENIIYQYQRGAINDDYYESACKSFETIKWMNE